MLPYYYGDPNQTVHLAREAQAIARDTPCAATALAAAAEARALARLGRREESETAMRQAQDLFERAAASSGDDAFSFPAQRLLFYLSGALTNLGETTRAADVQRQALDLYDQAFPIDPALLRLDQAIGLAGDDAVEDACHVAQDALTAVGDEHRTTILLTRARDVIAAIPQNRRTLTPVEQLRHVLALPAGQG
jgi:tetratricopeptide (TPR) repeat protein